MKDSRYNKNDNDEILIVKSNNSQKFEMLNINIVSFILIEDESEDANNLYL